MRHGVKDDALQIVVIVQDSVALGSCGVAGDSAEVPCAVALPKHLDTINFGVS